MHITKSFFKILNRISGVIL